ncbi:MAG: VOC family protein [Acidobacteriota bacterium]
MTTARNLLLLISALVLASGSLAQASPVPPPAESLLGSAPGPFVALSVADLDREVAWFRDVLGFSVHSQGVAPNNEKIRFALLQQDSALVELLQLPDAKPRAEAAPGTTGAHQIQGFFKSGFVVKDIDAAYKRLKALGISFAYDLGQPPNGPYRSFGVRDPEGNLLQFFGR